MAKAADVNIVNDRSYDTVETTVREWIECALDELDENEFLQIAEQVKVLITEKYNNPLLEDSDHSLTIGDQEFTTTLKEFSFILDKELSKRVMKKADETKIIMNTYYNMIAEISNMNDEVESSRECAEREGFSKISSELYKLILDHFDEVSRKIAFININVSNQIEDTKKGYEFVKKFPVIIRLYSQGRDISEYIGESVVVEVDGVGEVGEVAVSPEAEIRAEHVDTDGSYMEQSLSLLSDEEFLDLVKSNAQLGEKDTAKIFNDEFSRRFQEIGQANVMRIIIENYKEMMIEKIKSLTNLAQGLNLFSNILELKLGKRKFFRPL
jgi:hypothetical protein